MAGWSYFDKITEFAQKKKKETKIIKKWAEYICNCDTENGKIKDFIQEDTMEYMLWSLVKEIQDMWEGE